MKPYELLRPCGKEFPDGKQFGEWGPMWGYHFDENGIWVKGQKDGKGQHGGHDIICPSGTVLRAPGNGKVFLSGWQDPEDQKKGYGLRLVVELESPYSLYEGIKLIRPWLTIGHLRELWVPVGSLISRGTDFGLSGNSGNSSGDHVHLQLEVAGNMPRTPLTFSMVDY